MSALPPCPRCGNTLSWSCHGETGDARCSAWQSRGSDTTPRQLLCHFRTEIEREDAARVRFRYPEHVALREAVRRELLQEFKALLHNASALIAYSRPEDPNMTPAQPKFSPLSDKDLSALRAQLEDAVPWRDGVLTYDQATHLIKEVERLRVLVGEKDIAISTLVGILS